MAEAKQLSVFLSIIRREIFVLLHDLLVLNGLQEKSLDNVSEVLQQDFEPKPGIMAEHFFHRQDQFPTGTVAE